MGEEEALGWKEGVRAYVRENPQTRGRLRVRYLSLKGASEFFMFKEIGVSTLREAESFAELSSLLKHPFLPHSLYSFSSALIRMPC